MTRRTPRTRRVGSRRRLLLIAVLAAAACVAGVALAGLRQGISGRFAGSDGTSALEFKGSKVYVTSSLGTTLRTTFDVDGDRVIIHGVGGGQVYRRNGNTLDGGMGIIFVKP